MKLIYKLIKTDTPFKKGYLFFIIALSLFSFNCSSRTVVTSLEKTGKDSIAITKNTGKTLDIYKLDSEKPEGIPQRAYSIDIFDSQIDKLEIINESTAIIITQKNGIFIILNLKNPSEPKYLHLETGSDKLPSAKIRDAILVRVVPENKDNNSLSSINKAAETEIKTDTGKSGSKIINIIGNKIVKPAEKVIIPEKKTVPVTETVTKPAVTVNKLYVTYYSPNGTGVTECTIDKDYTTVQYKTMNKLNSGLKSDYVHQVACDTKGNLWFRYSPGENSGISRLTPNGEWSNYTHINSELSDPSVSIMKVEKQGEGLSGDNIWFASEHGLTRLTYESDGKETWKLYGKKGGSVGDFAMKIVGLEQRFSDAVMYINSVEILPDSLLFSNNKILYHFTGDNINSFPSDDIGGIEENYIESMFYRNSKSFVTIISKKKGDRVIKSFRSFDLTKRIWSKVDVYKVRKTQPLNILFTPINEKTDFVSLSYKLEEPAYAVYDYTTGEITPVAMPEEKK